MYIVDEKHTLLVGKEKVPAGGKLPAGIEKKIGEKGLASLLEDGVIHKAGSEGKAKDEAKGKKEGAK